MKNIGSLVFIFMVALGLTCYGAAIDTDASTSFASTTVDIISVSFVLFTLMSGIYFLFTTIKNWNKPKDRFKY
jgi:hypothetical protein